MQHGWRPAAVADWFHRASWTATSGEQALAGNHRMRQQLNGLHRLGDLDAIVERRKP